MQTLVLPKSNKIGFNLKTLNKMRKIVLTIFTTIFLLGSSIVKANEVEPTLLENVTLSCKKIHLFNVTINLGLVSFTYEKTKLMCNNGWESEPMDNFWT